MSQNLFHPLQFAYRSNRSVDDTVNLGPHCILQHLDSPGMYARVLFVDFISAAFNSVIPDILTQKLSQLSCVHPHLPVDYQLPD